MFKRKKKTRVEQARADIEKQIRVVNKQANQTRKELIKRLNHTADDLRSGLVHVFDREEQKQANKLAQDLEAIAQDIEKRAEKGLHDVTENAQDNVWGTIMVTFVVGLLFGWIIKNMLD
ncbi:MAG: hypothetical protein ACFE0Q_11705 [Anaerolineae bacterium]